MVFGILLYLSSYPSHFISVSRTGNHYFKMFSYKLLLCSVILVLRLKFATTFDEVETRIEHGTIFRKVFTLNNAPSIWIHTFAVKKLNMPMTEPRLEALKCMGLDALRCQQMNRIVRVQENAILDLFKEIQRSISEANQLIPVENSDPSRTRRALLDFVGRLSSYMFGTATDERVDLLQNALETSTNIAENNFKVLKHQQENAHSIIVLNSDRINNLINHTENISIQLNALRQGSIDRWKHLRHIMSTQSNAMISSAHNVWRQNLFLIECYSLLGQVTYLARALRKSKGYQQSLQILSEGYLPPFLISPNELRKTLDDISRSLPNKQPGFDLQFKAIHHYFKTRNVLSMQNSSHIFIQLVLPIQDIPSLFDIYRVLSFPIPHTRGYTTVLGLPNFLAVQMISLSSFDLNTVDLHQCIGHYMKTCKYVNVLSSNDQLIPVEDSDPPRTRRALLNFVGKLSSMCLERLHMNE